MLKIKVQGGTRASSEASLCDSCTCATTVQGMRSDQRIVHCGDISKDIHFNVETCGSYRAFGVMSLYAMKEIATIVEIKGNKVGFYSPADYRAKNPHKDVIPGYDD